MPHYVKPKARFRDKRVPSREEIPGLQKDDGKAPYAIDAAAASHSEGWTINRWFHDREEAKTVADLLAAKEFGCVRLYEWGKWASPRSALGSLEGWVAFWWRDTDADYVDYKPTGSVFGVPEGNKRPVDYTPLSR